MQEKRIVKNFAVCEKQGKQHKSRLMKKSREWIMQKDNKID